MHHSIKPLPLQGPTLRAPLFVQNTSVGAADACPGHNFLPPVTRAPITIQGSVCLPMANASMLFAIQRQDLEARELEVERRTRALNLNAVRDAEIRSAAPSVRSRHVLLRNRHPLNQCVLIPIPHLKDPFP